jgi:phosphoglycerate kinase
MHKLSLSQLNLKGKKVLMRVDFNVPLDEKGRITDATRIIASLPSIQYLLDHGAAVILMSHLGRPKGKQNPAFSLKPCAEKLSELLGKEVILAPDCVGDEVEKLVSKLKPGQVLMLENLRFHQAEEDPQSDPEFVEKLAKLGDLYVNDAFGTAHRSHASTAEIAKFFPGKAAAGFLLEKEIKFLGNLLHHPARPFVALVGGSKVSTKMGALKGLIKKVDCLLIGGAMAYTFLKAQGKEIGDSLCENDYIDHAIALLEICQQIGVKLLLPIDHAIVQKVSAESPLKYTSTDHGIPPGWQGVDIGPKTVKLFSDEIKKASTLLWNGPMGIFEIAPFAQGTIAIAKAFTSTNAMTIVGGGDSIAAIEAAGVSDRVTHISTGGGAALEYLEFGTLPGIEALSDATQTSARTL